MMSLAAIRDLSNQQARKAAKKRQQPYVPFNLEEVEGMGRIHNVPFPNIGTYVPKGWKRVTEGYEGEGVWFVDKGGWGTSGGSAMSIAQFLAALKDYYLAHPNHGYAIVEEGQFQIYIAAFEPV